MRQVLKQSIAALMIHTMVWSSLSHAAVPTLPTYTPTQAVPPNVQTLPARPLIMLNMSKDHQLFYRAYNEFSDYDSDGNPDGTYIHTVRYSGYFDYSKCYTYSATNTRYQPSGNADADNLCTGAWHGNFLNWATMTRMDVVRKVLYGGSRSTDTPSLTVLERASLPMDSHSFAKYYASLPATATAAELARRPNIDRLTPFNQTEVTFCNTTLGDNTTVSHTNTNPPLLRATSGNYMLWNAHERRQCRWADETQWNADGDNVTAFPGAPTSGNYPSRGTTGGTALPGGNNGDFVVRVEVCNSARIGKEECRSYPAGNLKPYGLLQEYGENDQAEFGLLTGSFSNNTSGGVLRKNASSFGNEVNHITTTTGTPGDGTFRSVDGIVRTLDRIKVYGFRYSDATYAAADNGPIATAPNGFCAFQTIGLTDNKCASWGNPLGEMFIESLRYLAGKTPYADYGNNTDVKGQAMSLAVATWDDPLGSGPMGTGTAAERTARREQHVNTFGAGQCRPVSAVNFNASVTSYDRNTAETPFRDLRGSPEISTQVNLIGVTEGIAGTSRFVGSNGTVNNSACTAKTIGNLWSVQGLCPAAPAYAGSFSLAGAAYWANTNAIRDAPTGLTTKEANRAFRVRTYGVALAPGVPRIDVRTQNTTPLAAVIQPSYRLDLGAAGQGSGTLVDFRVISQTATSGQYLVIWEDSEQGGDYDNDVTGILEWSLSGTQLSVTTRIVSEATVNPQGFGYTISGTNADGEHFHSGIENFSYTDATNVPVTRTDGTVHPNINASGGCNNCNVGSDASRASYTVRGNPAGSLQDPMWYAAKWGGFRDADGTASGTPALWDEVNNTTGRTGADGVPDTYFEVFNPDQLEQSLRQVFASAVLGSNAAPAVSASQLISNSLKYVASFDPKRINGDIRAYGLDGNRNFTINPSWSAGEQLTNASTAANVASRQIISNNQTTGIAFNWATVSADANYLSLLKGSTLSNAQAEEVVSFVRGDSSVEGRNNNGIRTRIRNTGIPFDSGILGPIVNSSPWLQDRPSARFRSSQHPGYAAFAAANSDRTKMLWVGAGDGMLHAFNADSGAPVMSYVPETLVPRLPSLTTLSEVTAFVDGSPFTADVDINAGVTTTPDWHTYLFSSLGRGGKGIFALDTTNATTLSSAAAPGNPASIFKWQFTANDDSSLGYVLGDYNVSSGTGQPSPVVKLQDGRFAVVFGNGTGSTTGNAALFILPVQGPSISGATANWSGRYHRIDLPGSPGNGLSTPTLLDTNNDGMADTVYAGDVQGNLWKIDISSNNPAAWGSAYKTGAGAALPLFIATDGTTNLAITGAPQFSFPAFGGTLVTFATGKSVVTSDFPRTDRTNRVFTIWDRPAFASGGRTLPRVANNTLVERTLTRLASGQVTVAPGVAIDYLNPTAASAKDGWYFNLPSSSEMVVSNLEYRARNIFFTSIRPPVSTACEKQPEATLYALNPETGLPDNAALGTVNITAGGVTSAVALIGLPVEDQRLRIVNDASNRTTTTTVTTATGTTTTTTPVCPDGSASLRLVGAKADRSLCFSQANSRFQWREIPGLRTK